jgi:hypothetical protein
MSNRKIGDPEEAVLAVAKLKACYWSSSMLQASSTCSTEYPDVVIQYLPQIVTAKPCALARVERRD